MYLLDNVAQYGVGIDGIGPVFCFPMRIKPDLVAFLFRLVALDLVVDIGSGDIEITSKVSATYPAIDTLRHFGKRGDFALSVARIVYL